MVVVTCLGLEPRTFRVRAICAFAPCLHGYEMRDLASSYRVSRDDQRETNGGEEEGLRFKLVPSARTGRRSYHRPIERLQRLRATNSRLLAQ
jgi:hypothetical protein